MTDKKSAVLRSLEIMFYRTPNHNDVRDVRIEILLKEDLLRARSASHPELLFS